LANSIVTIGLELLNILLYHDNAGMFSKVKYKNKSCCDLMIFTIFDYILMVSIKIYAK